MFPVDVILKDTLWFVSISVQCHQLPGQEYNLFYPILYSLFFALQDKNRAFLKFIFEMGSPSKCKDNLKLKTILLPQTPKCWDSTPE